MKNILSILLGLLLTSCGVGFQYTALNHAGHIDGIYSSNDIVLEVPSNIQIDTLNEFQLRRKLRTDFQFRYDFAQYAMNQPYSCLLYTSPSPRDRTRSRMPSSA